MIRGKKHILVGIPAIGSTVSTAIAAYTTQLMRESFKRGGKYKFSIMYLMDVRPTELARNTIITKALERKDVDAVWFMDSDMAPSPNSLDLLEVDADVAAGIAPILTNSSVVGPSFCYNLYDYVEGGDPKRPFKPIVPPSDNKPLKVDGAGSACMVIQRRVLEDRRLWLAPDLVDGIVPLFQWPRAITGQTLGTDDLDFCLRLRKLGYILKAHPGIRWGHLKTIDMDWIINKLAYTRKEMKSEYPITINDFNELQAKTIIQHNPSGEAPVESSAEALISKPAGEVMASCVGE